MISIKLRTALAVPLVIGVALAGACDAAKGTGPTGDGDTPVAGGTLTYALDSEPSCLDPHVSLADATALIDRGVVDSLVAQSPDGTFQPWLATSWKISPDLKTFTFDLRTGVKFHDGTPLDAAAVKANFDRIVDPATKSQYARTLIGPYEKTTVVDADTVEVHFSRAFQPFLQAASTAYLGIASPKSFTDLAGQLCTKVVGSGPFIFDSYTRQQNVTLRRNPDYQWAPATAKHTGPAHLETVVVRFLPENASRLGALTSGQVQGIAAVPPANVAGITGDANLQLVRTESRGAVYSVYLNTGRAPFDDERVRQAFRAAVDVDGLVKGLYFGQYARAWGILSPTTPLYEPAVENSWKSDEATANKLLDEAGWTTRDADGYRVKDGKRLAVRWPTTQQMESAQQRGALAQGIQAAAKKVGIEVVRDRIQTAQLFEQVGKGDYDLFDMSWARADPDILRGFLGSTNTFPIGQNVARVNDPQVDTWVNGATATLDEAARKQSYAQAQKWAIDHAVALPVFVPAYLLGASAKVHGLTADPAAFPLFYDAWLAA